MHTNKQEKHLLTKILTNIDQELGRCELILSQVLTARDNKNTKSRANKTYNLDYTKINTIPNIRVTNRGEEYSYDSDIPIKKGHNRKIVTPSGLRSALATAQQSHQYKDYERGTRRQSAQSHGNGAGGGNGDSPPHGGGGGKDWFSENQ